MTQTIVRCFLSSRLMRRESDSSFNVMEQLSDHRSLTRRLWSLETRDDNGDARQLSGTVWIEIPRIRGI